MSVKELYDTTGPGIELSRDARELSDQIVDVLESIPTITREEIKDRHADALFNDEFRGGHLYQPRRHILPGFGRKYDGSEGQIPCGAKIPHLCEEHGHHHDIGRTCSRSTCPRCAPAWVVKRAIGITAKIQSAAKMKDGAQLKHHGVVSPPREWYIDAEDKWDAALEAMGEFMDALDMDGIVLPHPWSGKPEDARAEESWRKQHSDDQGEWKKRLFEGRDWEGDVKDELQFRPHFHVIGAAEWFPGGGKGVSEDVYERTGWVIHRIQKRDGSGHSLSNIHDLARAVTYALSHVAIDTTGEQNTYLRKKKGSAYRSTSNENPSEEHARNLREAKEAVHNVAPKTLGIPPMTIECHEQVEKDQADKEYEASLLDDDPDADDLEGDGTDTTPEPTTRRCRADLVPVHKADFVEDPNWQQNAPHAEQAMRIKQRWEEEGGWEGLMGQATLTAELLENESSDDPPPD